MKDAAAYLAHIKAQIIANPHIVKWTTLREEAQGDRGLFRYRLILHNGDMFPLSRLPSATATAICHYCPAPNAWSLLTTERTVEITLFS